MFMHHRLDKDEVCKELTKDEHYFRPASNCPQPYFHVVVHQPLTLGYILVVDIS